MRLTIGLTISIQILNYSNKNKTKKINIYLSKDSAMGFTVADALMVEPLIKLIAYHIFSQICHFTSFALSSVTSITICPLRISTTLDIAGCTV